MRTDIPAPIQDTSHDLSPDALVILFKVELKNLTTFHLSPKNQVTWQGVTYDDIPCHMTEVEQEADGKKGRPKFTFVNPGGLFTSSVYNREMDNATVTRIRILKADLDADLDFALTEKLKVSKVLTMSKDLITVELRDVLDGHQFILPARAYYPPEFGHVSL